MFRPFLTDKSGTLSQLLSIKTQSNHVKNVWIHYDLSALDYMLLANPDVFYFRTSNFLVTATYDINRSKKLEQIFHDYFISSDRIVTLHTQHRTTLININRQFKTTDQLISPTFRCLDLTIFWNGTIGLNQRQLKWWLSDLETRIHATAMLMSDQPINARAESIVNFIHKYLSQHLTTPNLHIEILISHINNPEQLNSIDSKIALFVANSLSGQTQSKSFNSIPGWKIRKIWKLKSIREFI